MLTDANRIHKLILEQDDFLCNPHACYNAFIFFSGELHVMALILASASPRRRELLALLGIPFRVEVANIDERRLEEESPETYVRRLAEEKALAVAQRRREDIILAADTVVLFEGRILGKPKNGEEAWHMLHALRGKRHEVITAVALWFAGQLTSEIDRSVVSMRFYSHAEIAAYIASGDPMDKAGAYAIQNQQFRPVAQLEGCFAGVMGLPLALVVKLLGEAGIVPASDWIDGCQALTGSCCQFYTEEKSSVRHP